MNKKNLIFISVLYFLMVFVPALSVLQGDLIYDDKAILTTNEFVLSHDYKAEWSHSYWGGIKTVRENENLHRPLFLNLVTVFQDHIAFLRILVLGTHLCLGLLLFLALIQSVGFGLAAFAGALFLVHPAQTEVQAQIIGLVETVPLILGLSALFLAAKRPWLSLGVVALAPGFKETGYIAVGFLFLFFLMNKKKMPALTTLLVLTGWLAQRFWAYGSLFEFNATPYALLNPMVEMSSWDQFWSRWTLIGYNLRLLIFPFHLTSDYSRTTLPLPGYPLQVSVLLALGFCYFLFRVRKHLSWPILYGLCTVLPTLHLTGPLGIVFAERFGYGFRWAIVFLVADLASRSLESLNINFLRVFKTSGFALLILFLVLTSIRLTEWNNSISLFQADLDHYPFNSKLYFNLGVAYGARSDWENARHNLERSLELAPDFPEAHYRMGLVYRELNREDLAQNHWRAADQLGFAIPVDMAHSHH